MAGRYVHKPVMYKDDTSPTRAEFKIPSWSVWDEFLFFILGTGIVIVTALLSHDLEIPATLPLPEWAPLPEVPIFLAIPFFTAAFLTTILLGYRYKKKRE